MPQQPKPSDYATLGVTEAATLAEAQAAYHRRARVLHPDAHPDATPSERRRLDAAMAALNAAWDAVEGAARAQPTPPTAAAATFEAPIPRGFALERANIRPGLRLRLTGAAAHVGRLAALEGTDVQSLRLDRPDVSDRELPVLLRFRHSLLELHLVGSAVTDAGMRIVGQLHELRDLDVSETGVSDAGLTALTDLLQLDILTLVETEVTDVGLQSVGRLSSLDVLNLRRTRVEGTGLAHLVELPQLKILALPRRVGRRHRAAFTRARPQVQVV